MTVKGFDCIRLIRYGFSKLDWRIMMPANMMKSVIMRPGKQVNRPVVEPSWNRACGRMRLAIKRRSLCGTIVCLGLLSWAGCTREPEPIGTLADLFGARPPASVQVVNYKADILFLDPSFAWELAPIDDPFLQAMIAARKLMAPVQGEPAPSSGMTWNLRWWDQQALDRLSEVYYNDDSNGLRVWVDRQKDRMFIEFAGR